MLLDKIFQMLFKFICKRWNRQYYKYKNISQNVVFAASYHGLVRILSPQNCTIGDGTVINAGAVIHCAGGVIIGDYVHIGHGLCVYSSNHNYASQISIPYDANDISKQVRIGDCVWIGANVSILPGVTIGEGSVVGLGTVVTRDIPPGAVVAGNPAVVVGYRDMDIFYRLKSEKKFL